MKKRDLRMEEQIRILCVDDERNVLRALERAFLDDDYEILTAASGKEGLAILQETAPVHVVISDFRMPEMNGVDFLKEVRKTRPDTMRMLLSGYADTASVVSAINDGEICKFIPKPWNDDELRISIVNAVKRYFLNRNDAELTRTLKTKNEELVQINGKLERLVDEKASRVRLQKELLVRAQIIHDSIPVGVVGIDPDGIIVQCNKQAEKLLSCAGPDIIGTRFEEKLPGEVTAFIEAIPDGESRSGRFLIHGTEVKVTVGFMDNCNQQGTILVLAREE